MSARDGAVIPVLFCKKKNKLGINMNDYTLIVFMSLG